MGLALAEGTRIGLEAVRLTVGRQPDIASYHRVLRAVWLGKFVCQKGVTYRLFESSVLLRGDIDLAIDAYAAFRASVDDGKLRLLATSASTRSPLLQELQTGAGAFEATAWNGLFVKSGTPAAIVTQLNKVMAEVLADKDLKRRLLEMGIVADPTSPEDLTTFLKTDIAKWADVIARNKDRAAFGGAPLF